METGTDSPPVSARRQHGGARGSLRWAAATGVVTVAAIVGLSAGRADAQSVEGLQSRIDSAQGEAQSLAAQIEAGGGEIAAARAQAVSAATREAELSSVLAAGQEREAELAVEVDRSEERLERARARLERAQGVLADRLVAIYKGDAPDEASLLLDSDGFDDLTTRALLLRHIQEADAELVGRVRELRAEVSDQLASVEAARDAQAAHNAEVAAARDQIAAARARAEAEAAALAQALAEQVGALESLRSQVSTWEGQVQEAQAVSAEQAEETVAGWVGDWAIPSQIVICESGGNYGAINPSSGAGGAYQILPSTWRLYGGSGLPHQASRAEQDRIAAEIWADSGASAWVCAQ